MYKEPARYLETAISLNPQLVIIQAESDGDLLAVVRELRAVGIKSGLALLQQTEPKNVRTLVSEVDHVLIFSGTLGHFGGHADLTLLKKVGEVKAINPNVEVGWDGGVGLDNAPQIALGGVEVLIAGGAIQEATDAADAYKKLSEAVASEAA